MIKLGSQVRDIISGFSGVAMGRAVYLYDAPKILVVPKKLKDAIPFPGEWLNEKQLEEIKQEPPKLGF
jgi:hypothetical protein